MLPERKKSQFTVQRLLFYCTWVRKSLVEIISHSLFNTIEYAMAWYQKYIISGSHLKILQKLWKNIFLDPTGFEPGTFRLWDLHATKELWRLAVLERNFLWYFNKIACVQKISAILTSQSWKLEKKKPKFSCGNLIFTKVDRTGNYSFIIWPKTTL